MSHLKQSRSDCPDSGDADEQQSHSESLSYGTSTIGTTNVAHTTSNIPYPVLPPIGSMAQAAYPYPDPYYRSIFAPYDPQAYPVQPYPPQSMSQLQLTGIQQGGLPLQSDAVEEPIFVNAKQYHGIMRRRQSRAKAESERKAMKIRKPYLHESRHLHALRRARGCGGRFQKKEKQNNETASNHKKENGMASGDKSQPVGELDLDRKGNDSVDSYSS